MNLKDALKDELTEDELSHLVSSFEVMGTIAIIEIPDELIHRKRIIGKKLMEVNKHIETVLREASERKGEFRIRDYEVIAGEENTTTIHKEHGCRFKLDPTQVYFSEREATERQRIVEKVNEGEKILDMFAGIGPFSIVIARKKDIEKIYAIELNPDAYHFLEENIKLNKVTDKIEPLKGDVREVCPTIDEKFDRIIMHLPKDAEDFLELAMNCVVDEGIIHLYTISDEKNLYDDVLEKIKKIINNSGYDFKIKDKRQVLSYSPRTWKICLDIKLKK